MEPDTLQKQLNQRTTRGIVVASVSLIGNILLAALKFWIALQISSVAILADAWHTLSDSITSIVVLVGIKMAAKQPDREHPFGHGRMEVISSLIIAIILSLVAFNFMIESFSRLMQEQSVQYSQTVLIIFIVSLLIKELMAQISIQNGKKINSDSLIADGWHHRSDALTNLIIIVGIFVNPYFWWIDGAMGMFISLVIAKIAFNILKDTTSTLIGEKPEESFLEKLNEIVKKETSYNVQLHHIHLHRYGDHRELTFHIVLPGEMLLKQAHKVATQLEEKINTEMSVETTIHLESAHDIVEK
jgi:cation diffusion facilitator family transporter